MIGVMSNKPDSKIVRIDAEIMDGVMRNIKDSNISKKDFVSQAVEKEVKALDDDRDREEIRKITGFFRDSGVTDYAQMIKEMVKTKKDVQRLEKKIDSYDVSARVVDQAVKLGYMTIEKGKDGGEMTVRMKAH